MPLSSVIALNKAPLGLFEFISDYFEKNKYIFQYHNNKSVRVTQGCVQHD